MLVGLTYDLRDDYRRLGFTEEQTAEFDSIETIDALAAGIEAAGHICERIGHAHALLEALGKGRRWDLVFNIAEGLNGIGREAQIPAILDLHHIPYTFADASVLGLCLHKGLTKRVVRDAGVRTPAFAVIHDPAECASVRLSYPLFVKPVAEGTGKGITKASRVTTPEELRATCGSVIARFNQPALVEEFLPGREFTVGILGTGSKARVVGVMEVIFRKDPATNAYSYDNKTNYEEHMDYRLETGPLAEECGELALAAWRALECRDGGRLDIRLDAQGRPCFLEVNPLAGLNPVYSDLAIICRFTGMSYQELLSSILESAATRVTRVELPSAVNH